MDILDLALIGIIIGVFVGLYYGVTLVYAMTYVGQKYDVIVTVQAVEHSTRFGKHTKVWVRVYGEQDITYDLKGWHNLEVGKTYRIVFVNKLWITPIGFNIWGEVKEITEIS